MKVRLKTDIMGSYYGVEADHLCSVQRGDVVDLTPEAALHEAKNDRIELALTGPVGNRTKGANVKDVATLQKLVAAEEAKRPKQRTRSLVYDGATFVYPAD